MEVLTISKDKLIELGANKSILELFDINEDAHPEDVRFSIISAGSDLDNDVIAYGIGVGRNRPAKAKKVSRI